MSELRSYQREVARVISTEIETTALDVVTSQVAKLYARVDGSTEDSIIEDIIIPSALADFETFTGKLFFERTVTCTFQSEGYALFILPYLPVASITTVQKDGEDVDYDLKGDRLEVDAVGEVEVVYECGLFADVDSIGKEAQLGMLKYITSNYEDRQDVAAMGMAEMPNSSRKHWIRYKNFSL